MAVEGFNSEQFAQNLAQQAVELVPKDLDENQKRFVVNIIYRYCVLAGNALIQDNSIKLSAEQASIICQFIGEWTFHKSIDLIRGKVQEECWEPILQKIAFTIFEVAKKTQINNVPQEETMTIIEQEVNRSYREAINEFSCRKNTKRKNRGHFISIKHR